MNFEDVLADMFGTFAYDVARDLPLNELNSNNGQALRMNRHAVCDRESSPSDVQEIDL